MPTATLVVTSVLLFASVLWGESMPPNNKLPLLLVGLGLAAAALLSFWFHGKLRWVGVDENYQYVNSLFKHLTIPLSELESASPWSGYLVVIRLKQPSQFGRTIWFMAKYTPFLFYWQPHPVVAELQMIIDEHRKEAGIPSQC